MKRNIFSPYFNQMRPPLELERNFYLFSPPGRCQCKFPPLSPFLSLEGFLFFFFFRNGKARIKGRSRSFKARGNTYYPPSKGHLLDNVESLGPCLFPIQGKRKITFFPAGQMEYLFSPFGEQATPLVFFFLDLENFWDF